MSDRSRKEEDQLARVGRELRSGDWLANARARSKRRKSAWNLLLPAFGLPLLALFIALLLWLGQVLHALLHPGETHPILGHGPMSIGETIVSVSSFIAALAPAMLATNFLVYQIAPARRAMEAEDRNYSSVGYEPSQRALFKLGLWLLVICLPLMLLGAALK